MKNFIISALMLLCFTSCIVEDNPKPNVTTYDRQLARNFCRVNLYIAIQYVKIADLANDWLNADDEGKKRIEDLLLAPDWKIVEGDNAVTIYHYDNYTDEITFSTGGKGLSEGTWQMGSLYISKTGKSSWHYSQKDMLVQDFDIVDKGSNYYEVKGSSKDTYYGGKITIPYLLGFNPGRDEKDFLGYYYERKFDPSDGVINIEHSQDSAYTSTITIKDHRVTITANGITEEWNSL